MAVCVVGLLLAAPSQADRLANYFDCALNEGKTRADLITFKEAYERAIEEAGLEGYEIRVQFPVYASQIGPNRFFWDGSWAGFDQMGKISAWFNGSEWPAKFGELMSCSSSSLWRVVD